MRYYITTRQTILYSCLALVHSFPSVTSIRMIAPTTKIISSLTIEAWRSQGWFTGMDHLGQGPRVCAAGLGCDHGWVSAMSVVRSGSRACGYSVRPLQSV